MATFYQTEQEENFELKQLDSLVQDSCQQAIGHFKRIITSFTLFHLSFITVLLIQLITSLVLIAQPKSIVFAISLSSFIMTIFSYVIIGYYFQGKKPSQFSSIRSAFILRVKRQIPLDLDAEDSHLLIANSYFQLTTFIRQSEIFAITLPPFRFMETLSLKLGFILNWRDITSMQQQLMYESIREHIELVKLKPTSLSAHTSLANAYIALSKIYQKPQGFTWKLGKFIEGLFEKDRLRSQFSFATERAIEELKILDGLAPNDPWVHAQLATCFHHLEMEKEEIHEYETLLDLRPQDREILLRLGLLYFRLGMNAKGLEVYEQLKHIDAKDAQHLISHYNSMYL